MKLLKNKFRKEGEREKGVGKEGRTERKKEGRKEVGWLVCLLVVS